MRCLQRFCRRARPYNQEINMSIGTGIAIAGVWIFAGLLGHNNTVSGWGVLLGIVVAISMTIGLTR